MRKLALVISIGFVVVAAASYVAVRVVMPRLAGGLTLATGSGDDTLQRWIGRCLVGVIESYINPRVTFTTVTYRAPDTVILEGLRLVHEGETLLDVPRATLVLAEVPRRDRPIQIRRIALESPVVRLVARGDGLAGWSDFLRDAVKDPESVASGSRLSDVLALRQLGLLDGRVEYVGAGDHPPMILRGLSLVLDTAPRDGEPGWYTLDGDLGRSSLFDLRLDGRINLDTAELDLATVAFTGTIGDAQYEILPPTAQTWAREHELRGRLGATLSGLVPLRDAASARLQGGVRLDDAFAAFGTRILPLDDVEVTGDLSSGRLGLTLRTPAFGGRMTADATADLTSADVPLTATWTLHDVHIEESGRTASGSGLAGRVEAGGSVTMALARPLDTLAGDGVLTVEDGRLADLPLVRELEGILGLVTLVTLGTATNRDSARVDFTLRPDHAELTSIDVRTASMVARGKGRTYYDARLDLRLNAGPLEKLQSFLGALGEAIGSLTDKLVKYHVTGRIGAPKVTVRPLGIGIDDGDRAAAPRVQDEDG